MTDTDSSPNPSRHPSVAPVRVADTGQAQPGAPSTHPWLASYPHNVDWHMALDPRPLPEILDETVARHGNLPCTTFLGKTLTYREMGQYVERAAAGLQKLGVTKGTRVGLFLPNSPTFVIYYYGALKAGATVVNFNPLYTVEELAGQAADSGTEIMVTLDLALLFDKVESLVQQGALKQAVVANFPALLPATKATLFKLFKSRDLAKPAKSAIADRITFHHDLMSAETPFQPVVIDAANDIAVLQYTGGTTGEPKGAMLTHANLAINVEQVRAWAPELKVGSERVMGVLPFFHVFAMTVVMNYAVRIAAEMVLMPRFVLNDALKLITSAKPTVMPGVPTLYNAINNHPKLGKFDLSSLKFCMSGGAALPIDVKRRFEELTGCRLVEGYGLSETSPVATCNPLPGPIKEGSIGMPLPATVLSLRDLEDPSVEVPAGEKGEICIGGPQVMRGYWNKDNTGVFVDGLFRTGDVARVDEDGMFFIEDRIKDLIISNGYNVYPRRVEEAIYAHPAVEEVTVIGIPDEKRGEAPMAFIKLKSGATSDADDMLSHLAPKLSKIELPARIEFRDDLPKTMIGKLSKKELKAEVAEAQTRSSS